MAKKEIFIKVLEIFFNFIVQILKQRYVHKKFGKMSICRILVGYKEAIRNHSV